MNYLKKTVKAGSGVIFQPFATTVATSRFPPFAHSLSQLLQQFVKRNFFAIAKFPTCSSAFPFGAGPIQFWHGFQFLWVLVFADLI
jgi:hypothetical protein